MYTVRKRIEISASHSLKLSYESKCENLHGHNWIIVVWCRAKQLNDDGMVVDFTHIKQKIQEQLDHRNLNEVLSFNSLFEKYLHSCDVVYIFVGRTDLIDVNVVKTTGIRYESGIFNKMFY